MANIKKCRYFDSNKQICGFSGSSYYHQLCIGKVHCSSYAPPQSQNSSEKKKQIPAKNKSMSQSTPPKDSPDIIETMKPIYNAQSDVVSYNDEVVLYCIEDNEDLNIKMSSNEDTMSPVQAECLNKNIGTEFSLRGYTYQIKNIIKTVKS